MPLQKQLNLSHVHIDSRLQGSTLASFSRRTLAYLIDWTIVFLCTQYVWLTVLVACGFILLRKKLRLDFSRSSTIIRYNLRRLDRQLEKYEVEAELRGQLKKHLHFYIYVAIYAPIVVSVMVLAGITLGILSPNEYGALTERYVQGAAFFHPFKDIYNGFTFIANFVGGLLYFTLFTWRSNGQTPGKRMLRIRVVKLNGTRISLWNSLERFSGYSASASLLLLGFFQYYWDRNAQTTHDKITETIVIQA
jgi:uncharacterized RDD family membrane protein YckC